MMRSSHLVLVLLVFVGCTKQPEDESASQQTKEHENRNTSEASDDHPEPLQEPLTSEADEPFSEKLSRLLQTAARHEKDGEYERAIRTRREILALIEKQFGQGSWQATNARLSIENTDYKSRLTPQQHAQLANIRQLDRQARELVVTGQMPQAEVLYAKILEAVAEVWPKRSHAMARYAFLKAQVSVSNNQLAEAERRLEFALPVLEENLGPVHPEYAAAVNSLGMLYLSTGRLEEARPLLLKATELTEQVWGRRSRNMATQLNNLGTLWHTMEKYEEAEPIFSEALEVQRETVGPGHASVAHTSFNLGALYISEGEYRRAAEQLERAAEIYEREAAPDSWTQIRTLSSLATAYYSLRQYAKAESLLRRVVEFGESKLGPANDVTIDSTFRLAMSLCFQAKYEEAEPLLLRALKRRRRKFGDTSPELLPALRAYAELLDRTGRKASSKHVMSQVGEIQTRTASRQPLDR